MEIMMMTKYRKCPGDWVAEVECTRHPGGGRSRNPETRGQVIKGLFVWILKSPRVMEDVILESNNDLGTKMVKK